MSISESEILGASILIVDDQPVNVILLEQMLRDVGYLCVSSTTDPRLVYELHHKNRYDLILLDLQMPAMDGFQVIEALRADAAEAYLPVLAITAQPAYKLRALQAGARDFVSKPFDLLEVRTRIRNMLEVRLLYRKLENYNSELEAAVEARTRALCESEDRYRSLTELASDWYWEQDAFGDFTKVSGPILELLGLKVQALAGDTSRVDSEGWNEADQARLRATIVRRQPFVDLALSRSNADGSEQLFRVSGEPMFDRSCRFVGYRGIGVELTKLL